MSLQHQLLELPFSAEIPRYLESCAAADSLGLFHDSWPPASELDGFLPEVVVFPTLVEKEHHEASTFEGFSLQPLVEPVVCDYDPVSFFR